MFCSSNLGDVDGATADADADAAEAEAGIRRYVSVCHSKI